MRIYLTDLAARKEIELQVKSIAKTGKKWDKIPNWKVEQSVQAYFADEVGQNPDLFV